jgi:hypothetical protein
MVRCLEQRACEARRVALRGDLAAVAEASARAKKNPGSMVEPGLPSLVAGTRNHRQLTLPSIPI